MHRLSFLLLLLAALPATAEETLDLSLDPNDVEDGRRSPVITGPSKIPERVPGVAHPDRGWSLNPEADADLRTGGDDSAAGGSSLNDLEFELESLGLRLQRTW